MKVLMISRLYPSAADPQFGRFNFQLAQALRSRCELDVVAPTPGQDGSDFGARHPRYFSVPLLNRVIAGQSVYRCLKQLRLQADAILATFAWPDGYAAVRLGRQLGVPVVIKTGGSDIDLLPASGPRRTQTLEALRGCAKIYVVAGHLRETILRMGIEAVKVSVIHNGIDPALFCPGPQDTSAGKLLLYVGWIEPDKGVEYLVQALTQLPADVSLVMIGRGITERQTKELAAKLGLGDRCRLIGPQPHESIAAWMKKADVFAFPSLHEGCPNVILEALACGLPVVSTNVGGIPEITPREPWCELIPPRDAGAMAAALKRMLARKFDRTEIAQASRRTWSDVAREVFSLLETAHV